MAMSFDDGKRFDKRAVCHINDDHCCHSPVHLPLTSLLAHDHTRRHDAANPPLPTRRGPPRRRGLAGAVRRRAPREHELADDGGRPQRADRRERDPRNAPPLVRRPDQDHRHRRALGRCRMTAAMTTGHAPIGADVLSRAELIALADCEQRIETGLKTFIEVGMALGAIQQNRLYRAQFDTFEEYCAARWGFTGRRGRQLIEAAAVGTIVPVENEGQARALAAVPEAERGEVLAEARERTGGKTTAKAITEVAKERAEPKPTQSPEPAAADPSAGAGSGSGRTPGTQR